MEFGTEINVPHENSCILNPDYSFHATNHQRSLLLSRRSAQSQIAVQSFDSGPAFVKIDMKMFRLFTSSGSS